MQWCRGWIAALIFGGVMIASPGARAEEKCTTQAQMAPAERDALAAAAQSLATKIQANDVAGVKADTIPEFAANFDGMAASITSTAPHLAGQKAEVEQIYFLDSTTSKANPDGSFSDAEFICPLNKGSSEADFSISSLPPGRYAFTLVNFSGEKPWLLSMLLRQDGPGAPWKLGGLFPKSKLAAGHDGLWYWQQGRTAAANKQPWNAYFDFLEAQDLLKPAVFVSSTHLENLRSELSRSTPEAAESMSADTPLIVKGSDGTEYRFTSLGPTDQLHREKLEIAVHMAVDRTYVADPAAARKHNINAMDSWLALHPEVRDNFHGMWIFADTPDNTAFSTEAAMNEIHP